MEKRELDRHFFHIFLSKIFIFFDYNDPGVILYFLHCSVRFLERPLHKMAAPRVFVLRYQKKEKYKILSDPGQALWTAFHDKPIRCSEYISRATLCFVMRQFSHVHLTKYHACSCTLSICCQKSWDYFC